ncbi:hypothetical protein GCM10018980_58460 [Streptomyces capoamus]|uniref:Uncharacterized protein n=1 Tax=Streptomyces capoamus TaxID=68183 RepID=A0A919F0K9_9ACTN|nr:hypothetical protein [Streptomyces capoamus]GGW18660.1 hypothetical protein GCM10010501_48160 [Streptomyces libani subsp. rufus]GHG66234.1 hypothetical protein GCM10018980_58460 [Streptomyces capoamus]
MTDAKLQKAREAALKAQRELEALEAAEAEKAARLAAERDERARDYDRRTVGNWRADEEENRKAEGEALEHFLTLVSDEPWFAAFVEYRAYRYKRGHILTAAQNAQTQLGESVTVPENQLYDSSLIGDLVALADRKAAEVGADFADELDAKREAYLSGEGA